MRETHLISLTFFFLGLFLIIFSYINQKPLKLKDLKEYLGEIVLVKGKVLNISKTKTNKTKLLITYGTSKAYIILPYNISCKEIMVKGRVSEFYGKYYIFVFKRKDILFCKK